MEGKFFFFFVLVEIAAKCDFDFLYTNFQQRQKSSFVLDDSFEQPPRKSGKENYNKTPYFLWLLFPKSYALSLRNWPILCRSERTTMEVSSKSVFDLLLIKTVFNFLGKEKRSKVFKRFFPFPKVQVRKKMQHLLTDVFAFDYSNNSVEPSSSKGNKSHFMDETKYFPL